MRWNVFLFVAFLGLSCSISKPNSTPKITPLPSNGPTVGNDLGERIHDFSLLERLAHKPFSESKRIDLVTMDRLKRPVRYKGQLSTPELPGKPHPMRKIGGSSEFRILDDKKTLSAVQIDSLTDILFNFGYGPIVKGKRWGPALCWNPKQALFFYKEEQDTVPFACIEICLECREIATLPEEFYVGNYCSIKFSLLRDFFQQTGITYGLEGDQ